jgi:hypothetical protein
MHRFQVANWGIVGRQDYMLFELLKNAMRAMVEAHRRGRSLPPVHVHICKAPSSVTLRISDQVRTDPHCLVLERSGSLLLCFWLAPILHQSWLPAPYVTRLLCLHLVSGVHAA